MRNGTCRPVAGVAPYQWLSFVVCHLLSILLPCLTPQFTRYTRPEVGVGEVQKTTRLHFLMKMYCMQSMLAQDESYILFGLHKIICQNYVGKMSVNNVFA
jgi:hypothetical protein